MGWTMKLSIEGSSEIPYIKYNSITKEVTTVFLGEGAVKALLLLKAANTMGLRFSDGNQKQFLEMIRKTAEQTFQTINALLRK